MRWGGDKAVVPAVDVTGFFFSRLQDDNSVRSFLDCAWVSTDILKRNELYHPEDADLIIGYLFQVFFNFRFWTKNAAKIFHLNFFFF